jgi:hypothetical protein
VDFPWGNSVADLVQTVEAAGYTEGRVKLQPAARAE